MPDELIPLINKASYIESRKQDEGIYKLHHSHLLSQRLYKAMAITRSNYKKKSAAPAAYLHGNNNKSS